MTSKEHFLRRKAELFEKECVEINVRPHCFYPACEHVDYITLNGFVVTKAATNWAPPTALQDGMIGPHWSKGWLIDNCDDRISYDPGMRYPRLRPDRDRGQSVP